MATHSGILAWRISMDKGAWQAAVHGVAKSVCVTKCTHTHTHTRITKDSLITQEIPRVLGAMCHEWRQTKSISYYTTAL